MAGRVHQKQRTRQALIDAAAVILEDGHAVTISGVAEAAMVSPATAYRYFSQPHELVVETVMARGPLIISDLPADPGARLDEVVRRNSELQFGDEALWRAVLAAALDRWSDQAAHTSAEQVKSLRSGARMEMTRRALAPLQDTLGPDLHRRLTMAVMLVYGMEALVVTRDACGLEPEEAQDVMRWAAQALLQAATRQAACCT